MYAILMVLKDFKQPLNIVTDSQYTERVVLPIETAKFMPDDTELTSLSIEVQNVIRNRIFPIYIIHINLIKVCQVLMYKVMLKASEFHKKIIISTARV